MLGKIKNRTGVVLDTVTQPQYTEAETCGFADYDESDMDYQGESGYQDIPAAGEGQQPLGPDGAPLPPGEGTPVIPKEGEDGVDMSGKNQIGPWQAGWNVTNAIQGMFIVSLPFAVLHGGWWGFFALIFVAWICYYTGMLLIECLYEDGVRVRASYVEIASACWGPFLGGRLVHAAQLTELLMTDILYVVLCGDLLEGSFPSAAMDRLGWMIFSTVCLLPCAFLTNLRSVSTLSFYNTISHVVINVIIFVYCLTYIHEWHWGDVRWTIDMNMFPTVLGIVVFSYTSQIFLPTLEGNMVDPSKFQPMLKWSHIAAAAFKVS